MAVCRKNKFRLWTGEKTHYIFAFLNNVVTYNNMPIVYVPQSRFNSDITMNAGTDAWGFTPAGSAINFLIVEKSAVLQVQKMALPKIFDPDTNQDKDAWKFQYRLYHDMFVYPQKAAGIYCHSAV